MPHCVRTEQLSKLHVLSGGHGGLGQWSISTSLHGIDVHSGTRKLQIMLSNCYAYAWLARTERLGGSESAKLFHVGE
jgi:hypothetical protein